MLNPFKALDPYKNAIVPDKCFVHGNENGLILRFAIGGELSPAIQLDQVLAANMRNLFNDYFKQLAELQRNEDTKPEQPTAN
jgi:hypothetical protein